MYQEKYVIFICQSSFNTGSLMVKITMWIKDEFHILFRLNLIKQFQLEHEMNCFI